jgi:hypothetical protein
MVQIGASSIANSRIVVRELEVRLNGASKEELSELARTELENVVNQIKSQQDILSRQDQLTEIVRDHDDELQKIEEADEKRDKMIVEQMQKGMELERQISMQGQKVSEQRRILTHQQQKDEEHDRMFREVALADEEQDELIAKNKERVEEHARLLEEVALADEEQDELIAKNKERVEEHARLLKEVALADEEQDRLIEEGILNDQKQNEIIKKQSEMIEQLNRRLDEVAMGMGQKGNIKMVVSAFGVSILALILAILQFFV